MLRRRFLRGAAASGALYLGTSHGLGSVGAAQNARTRIRLGYLGNVCEAATYAAPVSQIFHDHGLDARLAPFRSEHALLTALSSGTIDAASMLLSSLLRPLAEGLNVRVVAGLHAGCIRVVSPNPMDLSRLEDLRGKLIATDRIGGASMNLLSALLGAQGIDPRRAVAWRAYGLSNLATALEAKEVACVAAADPLGYFLLKSNFAEPYIDTSHRGFTCGEDFEHGHHCFLALHGALVEEHPSTAAAVTRAFLAQSEAIPMHVGPEAFRDARGGYADGDVTQTIGMLSSYLWNPSTEYVAEEIELSARDFQNVGLLSAHTDPHGLATQTFANVLHV